MKINSEILIQAIKQEIEAHMKLSADGAEGKEWQPEWQDGFISGLNHVLENVVPACEATELEND